MKISMTVTVIGMISDIFLRLINDLALCSVVLISYPAECLQLTPKVLLPHSSPVIVRKCPAVSYSVLNMLSG